MKTNESSTLLRNIGFGEDFFEKIDKDSMIYIIKREKIRKVFSESAVTKVENYIINKKCREEEDLEMYKDIEHNDPFDTENNEGYGTYIRDENFIEKNHQGIKNDEKDELTNSNSKMEPNLEIFRNCSQNQIDQLNKIFKDMNSSKEEKVLVKAYKSKLKTKFYRIYEENSQEFKEKIKYKIFHKCNYPSCGRTFASAGWLRSHFNEHLKDLKKNKFNILFDNFLESFKNNYYNMTK